MIVHPKDPNTVYVAALGHPFGPNTDARSLPLARWRQDLAAHPVCGRQDRRDRHPVRSNPIPTFFSPGCGRQSASRGPWNRGGPGSGLYRSADGGDTWTKLTGKGLPEGTIGRIGIATTPNPNRIYALIEAEKGGLFRSDDGGEKWNSSMRIAATASAPGITRTCSPIPKIPMSSTS